MSKKSRQVLQEKIEGRHPQLSPRVSPILVTPLLAAGVTDADTTEQQINGSDQ